MQSCAWIELLRCIPPAQQDNLILVTTIGTEISIQGILQTKGDCLVIRGRLGGTADTGRVFFVPYNQINYLGFIKALPEAQALIMLGLPVPEGVMTEAAATAEAAPAVAAAPSSEAPPEAAPAPGSTPTPPADAAKPSSRPAIPDKARLLERLRARSHSSGAKSAEER